MAERKPLYSRGRKIGIIEGDKFIKIIKGSKHILQIPPSIAIDGQMFDMFIKNCALIEVRDTESKIIRTTTVKNFEEKKIILNRGYGKQYALLLTEWNIL